MKENFQRIKLKHLSVPTLILLLVFALIRVVKPEFYNRIVKEKNPHAQNNGTEKVGSMLNIEHGSGYNPEPTLDKCSSQQNCVAKVIKVVDGDTIDISTGEKVRYVGVDTPETKHPTKGVQCFGKEASAKNTELVEGKEVRLEKDVSDKDKYGRLLRYVYINSDNLFVNDFLARNGYAHAATFPPDVKFSKQFVEAEREARQSGRGLWTQGVCP